MGDSSIDIITHSPQVIVNAEDAVGIRTQSIYFSIRKLACTVRQIGDGQLRRFRPRYGHVNRPGSSQPTEKANDQVGTHPQYISRISENLKFYVPQMFPLGPFHRAPQSETDESENIKSKLLLTRYGDCHFRELVNNMRHDGVTSRIREWYVQCQSPYSNENLSLMMAPYSDEDLGRMMARDGLFLLQFLRSFGDFPNVSRFAVLLKKISTSPVYNADGCFRPLEQQFPVEEDVMKIDNQIPIFVLQKILEWEAGTYQWDPDRDEDNLIHQWQADTDQDLDTSLKHAWVNLSPFRYECDSQDSHVIAGVPLRGDSHVLEFVYENIIRSSDFKDPYEQRKKNRNIRRKIKRRVSCITLPPAIQLKDKGVKFAPNKGLLDEIRFDRGNRTLYLPTIEMYGRTDVVLRNLVRFEASKQEKKSQPLMSYVDLMGRLIDKADDVQALRNGGIIHSHLGTNNDVANVWNGMRRELPAEIIKYKPIDNAMDDVICFYTSKYRIMYAEFKRRYCSKPWIIISVISAFILLGLSVVQTLLAWEQVRLQLKSLNKT